MEYAERIIGSIFFGGAVFFLVVFWRSMRRYTWASVVAGTKRRRAATFLRPLLLWMAALLRRIRVMSPAVHLLGGRAAIERRLEWAGMLPVSDVEPFVALRVLALVLLPIACVAIGGMHFRAVVVGVVLGAALPPFMMRRRQGARRMEIELVLPGVLDHLALLVEAGVDFAQAFSKVTASLPPGPLRALCLRVDRSVRVGIGRQQALREMAALSGSRAVGQIAALLIQADVLGVPIGPVLKSSAERLRADRLRRAERRGMAAAQKALFPLVLCIMPAAFFIIFGPLLVRFLSGDFASLFGGAP